MEVFVSLRSREESWVNVNKNGGGYFLYILPLELTTSDKIFIGVTDRPPHGNISDLLNSYKSYSLHRAIREQRK